MTISPRNPPPSEDRFRFAAEDGHVLWSLRVRQGHGRQILFFGAPGLPLDLSVGWLRGLSEAGEVAGVETRGFVDDSAMPDLDLSPERQARDAFALRKTLGWHRPSHVVGVCGGAALALLFAALYPESLASLTLWFGDYDLGEKAPKTDHQHNLKSVLEMVTAAQVRPEDALIALRGLISVGAPPEIAPLVLHPYSTPRLFENYCRMNHAVMSLDCAGLAGTVTAPCLVGYGVDDQTTHPDGSRFVARATTAQVAMIENRPHLTAIRGEASDAARVLAFQEEVCSISSHRDRDTR